MKKKWFWVMNKNCEDKNCSSIDIDIIQYIDWTGFWHNFSPWKSQVCKRLNMNKAFQSRFFFSRRDWLRHSQSNTDIFYQMKSNDINEKLDLIDWKNRFIQASQSIGKITTWLIIIIIFIDSDVFCALRLYFLAIREYFVCVLDIHDGTKLRWFFSSHFSRRDFRFIFRFSFIYFFLPLCFSFRRHILPRSWPKPRLALYVLLAFWINIWIKAHFHLYKFCFVLFWGSHVSFAHNT